MEYKEGNFKEAEHKLDPWLKEWTILGWEILEIIRKDEFMGAVQMWILFQRQRATRKKKKQYRVGRFNDAKDLDLERWLNAHANDGYKILEILKKFETGGALCLHVLFERER